MGVCRESRHDDRLLLRRRREAVGRYAWYGEDFASGSTHPVGQKEPNGWGLYDVHGNVWEWVQDWYDERYYANSPVGGSAGTAVRIAARRARRQLAPDRHELAVGIPQLVRPGLPGHQHWLSAGALDRTVSDGSRSARN